MAMYFHALHDKDGYKLIVGLSVVLLLLIVTEINENYFF